MTASHVLSLLRAVRLRARRLKAGLEADIRVEDRGATMTCVSFSGVTFAPGLPRFEFGPTIAELGFNLIQVRDTRHLWYQRGIRRTSGLEATCDLLRREVAGLRVPAFAMGNSAGGYAALLFASRLKLAGALAFAPQTFMDEANRLRYGDERWAERMPRLLAACPVPADIRDELLASPVPSEVWYAAENREDVAHAERLAQLSCVTFRTIPGDDHLPALVLRREDRLNEVIEDFVRSLSSETIRG